MIDIYSKQEPIPLEAVLASPPRPGENRVANCYLEFNVSFMNSTGLPMTVTVRNGMSYTIPSADYPQTDEFIIRHTYSKTRDVVSNLQRLSATVDKSSHPSLIRLRELMANERQSGSGFRSVYQIDHSVSLDDLQAHGGCVYLTDLDIVVAIGEHAAAHPYSETATKRRMLGETDGVGFHGSFGYAIRIVDKTGRFGPRYVNINGAVYKVSVVRNDWAERDGVYISTSGEIKGDFENPPAQCLRLDFEEAEEKLGLYRTYDDAKNLGDALAAKREALERDSLELKAREQELRRERVEIEAELEKERRRYEEEKMAFERKVREEEQRLKSMREELDHERKLREMKLKEEYETDALRRKASYEEASYSRRDSSEFIKFVPVVLTGMAAAGLAIFKLTRG